jgi:anti-sigma B factor antagonist
MLKDAPLTISRRECKAPETRIVKLAGPLTLPNLFAFQDELHSDEPPAVIILDLSEVPYMDSAGIGAIINHFVHCRNRNSKLIVVGVDARPLELFKLTGVHTVIPMYAKVEEAEASL